MPGPVPKRSSARRRTNAESRPDTTPALVQVVEAPPVPRGYRKPARDWYESLATSGQSAYFEPSDWALALIVAFEIDQLVRYPGVNASAFNAVMLATARFGTTEADRRRMRIEITRARAGAPEATEQRPSKVIDYRARMAKGGRRATRA